MIGALGPPDFRAGCPNAEGWLEFRRDSIANPLLRGIRNYVPSPEEFDLNAV